jgi:hypothetical protein
MMMKPAPDPYNYKGTAESRSHYDHNDLPWARNTKYVTETQEGCLPYSVKVPKRKQHGHISLPSVRRLVAFNHHHDDSSTSSIDNIDLSRPLRPYQPPSFKRLWSVVTKRYFGTFRSCLVLPSCQWSIRIVYLKVAENKRDKVCSSEQKMRDRFNIDMGYANAELEASTR